MRLVGLYEKTGQMKVYNIGGGRCGNIYKGYWQSLTMAGVSYRGNWDERETL
jgi:hypothetical protein